VKRLAGPLLLALFLLLGAGSSGTGSGLRGTVLLDPGYPTCRVGTSCTRPAAHALLRFWRHGTVKAHTRADGKGRYRIALPAGRYRVTSANGTMLEPAHSAVATDRYRRVTFRLDIGIR
jgi:hypothetical protein